MIERILNKFGYCRADECLRDCERAYRDGREDGEREAERVWRDRIEVVRLQYSWIERERDALHKLIADGKALQPLPPIIIKGGAAVQGQQNDE